jgi:crossover junction endodeoxyribonuclease RuvC
MNAIRPIPEGAVRILGLDPGLRKTGWGVIVVEGARLSHVAHGVIAPKDTLPFAERLLILFDAIAEVIALHAPDEAAVEETFMNDNARSALKLGHARACCLIAPARAGLPVAEYAATVVKKAVVGACCPRPATPPPTPPTPWPWPSPTPIRARPAPWAGWPSRLSPPPFRPNPGPVWAPRWRFGRQPWGNG